MPQNNTNKPSLTPMLLFTVLAILTLLCHSYVDQYQKSGPEMLAKDWHIHGSETGGSQTKNGLLLFLPYEKNASSKSILIDQNIRSFEQGTILKLSADMKCRNIQPGKKSWNLARLLFVQNNGQKNQWNLPHQVASLTGTKDWIARSQIFIIGPKTKTIKVIAQLSQCTGSFWLKNIHLYPVVQAKIYTWIKTGILGSWAAFAVFLLGSCFFYSDKKTLLQVLLTLAFIAIVIGTTMPGNMKTRVSKQIENQIQTTTKELGNHIPPKLYSSMLPLMPKAGHFCFFLLFAIILSMLLNHNTSIIVMLHILLIAGGTEMAQFYIDGRTPMLTDFAIDACGGFFGLAANRGQAWLIGVIFVVSNSITPISQA